MRNPTVLTELVEAVELAEASFARDAEERVVATARRVNVKQRPPEAPRNQSGGLQPPNM